MRWIFRNEERVWKARGGRPSEETLGICVIIDRSCAYGDDIFLGFIATGNPKGHFGHEPFAGVVIFADEPEIVPESKSIKKFQSADVVAYCVGDFISTDTYEVVTAWVDPRFKGMEFAVKV